MSFQDKYTDSIVLALRQSRPRLAAFFAPAGYGKSARARSFLDGFERRYFYDSRGLDVESLLRKIRTECVDVDDSTGIVIDNLCWFDDAQARAVIDGAMRAMKGAGRLLLCAVREPAFSLTEFVEASNVSVFRRGDLGLTMADLERGETGAESLPLDQVAQMLTISNGWPAVTQFLFRLAREGRLEEALGNIVSPAWFELLDWLEREVLSVLPLPVRQALMFAAATVDSAPEEFGVNPSGRRLDVLLYRDYQLADIGMLGEVRVLPVVRIHLYARHRKQLEEIARDRAERLQERDPVRSARYFVHAGDYARAEQIAASSEQIVFALAHYPYPGTVLEVLSQAPPLALHPHLWLGLVPARWAVRGPRTLAAEAENALDVARVDEKMRTRMRAVAALLSYEMIDNERGDAHLAGIEDAEEAEPLISLALLVRDFNKGRFQAVLDRWRAVAPSLTELAGFYGWIGTYATRAAAYAGDFERAQRMGRMQLNLSTRAVGATCMAAWDAAFIAWFHCDHNALDAYRSETARIARYYDVPALWPLIAALYGVQGGVGAFDERVRFRAGFVLAQILGHEPTNAATVATADAWGTVSLRILSRLQASMHSPDEAARYLEEAMALAQQTDSKYLRDSIAAAQSGDFTQGVFCALSRYGANLRSSTVGAPSPAVSTEAALAVDLIGLRILRNAEPLRISERVRELLFVLAANAVPMRRDALVDRLWPDLDGDAASSALKMAVYRARQQLQDSTAIVVEGGTYRLGATVGNDFSDVLKRANAITNVPMEERERERCDRLFARLCGGLAAHEGQAAWLLPVTRALLDAALSTGERLFRDAMTRGDLHRAIEIGRTLAAHAPDLETPRAMLIEAYRTAGDDARAQREYDDYVKIIRARTGEPPSAALRDLTARSTR